MQVDVITLGIVCADVVVRPVEEMPERGGIALVSQLELHLGGLASVTAAVCAQLGGKSAFIGCVGEGGFGDFTVNAMKSAGVNTDCVRRASDCGNGSTVVLVSKDGERTFLHHIGTNALVGEEDVDFDLVGGAKVLHWGGPSVTPRLDGEPIGRVLRQARDMGVMTSMDTCFDASGLWFKHIEHALPHLDVVMSSLEEARHYTGEDTPEEIAAFYKSFGAGTVMVKLGGEGMYIVNAHESYRLPAHDVEVVDTTGAGDAACGAFLYGLVEGWGLLECGKLANAVGALTVQRMGGAEAIGSLDDALVLMEGR